MLSRGVQRVTWAVASLFVGRLARVARPWWHQRLPVWRRTFATETPSNIHDSTLTELLTKLRVHIAQNDEKLFGKGWDDDDDDDTTTTTTNNNNGTNTHPDEDLDEVDVDSVPLLEDNEWDCISRVLMGGSAPTRRSRFPVEGSPTPFGRSERRSRTHPPSSQMYWGRLHDLLASELKTERRTWIPFTPNKGEEGGGGDSLFSAMEEQCTHMVEQFEEGEDEDALVTFRDMERRGLLSAFSTPCRIFFRGMIAHRRFDTVLNLLPTLQGTVPLPYTEILEDLGRLGAYEEIIHLLNRMKEHEIQPRADAMDRVLAQLSRSLASPIHAQKIVDRLAQFGILPTDFACACMIRMMTKHEMFDAAEHFMDISQPYLGPLAFGAMLEANNRRTVLVLDRQEELWNRMAELRISPNAKCYAELIRAYGRSALMEECDRVYQELLVSADFEASRTSVAMARAFAAYQWACVENENLDKAVASFTDMRALYCIAPLDCNYAASIAAHGKAHRMDDVFKCVESVKSTIVGSSYAVLIGESGVKSLGWAMRACVEHQLYNECKELYEEIMEKAASGILRPSVMIFTYAMACFLARGMNEEGTKVWHALEETFPRSMWTRVSKEVCDVYLQILAISTRHPEAQKLLDIARTHGYRPSRDTAAMLLESCVRSENIDAASYLFSSFKIDKVPMDHRSYHAILRLCSNSLMQHRSVGSVKRIVSGMRRDGVPLTTETYRLLLSALARGGEADRVMEELAHMEEDGIKPDACIYGHAVVACRAAGRLTAVRDLMDHATRNRVDDASFYVPLLESCTNSNQGLEDALRILEHTREREVQPVPEVYLTILQLCVNLKRWDRAQEVFQDMQTRDCLPNDQCYHLLLECAMGAGDATGAVDVWKDMQKNGANLDTRATKCLEKAYLALGDTKTAKLFKVKKKRKEKESESSKPVTPAV